jgi:hypothetical protein
MTSTERKNTVLRDGGSVESRRRYGRSRVVAHLEVTADLTEWPGR